MTESVEIAIDVAGTALDDDHRPVIEETDTLASLLAFLDDPHVQFLAGQDRGLDRIRERIDVHDPHALQLGDPVEVEIVGHDDPAPGQGQGDQLRVDLGDLGHVILDDLDRGARFLLHPVEDLEAASPAVAAQGVGAVSDVLEFIEDEASDHECPVDEPGLDDLGDPPVDDRAGVDHDAWFATDRSQRVPVPRGAQQPDGLGRDQEVLPLGNGQAQHPEPNRSEIPSGSHAPQASVKPDSGNRAAPPSAGR